MADATLGQIDARITEIDDLLFKGETGQIPMRRSERQSLTEEAKILLELVSKGLGRLNGTPAQEIYEMREKIRQLNHIAAVAKRDLQLNPEPNPEHDAIIKSTFDGLKDGSKTNSEVSREIYSIYSYMFVDPQEDDPIPRKNLLKRLFGP